MCVCLQCDRYFVVEDHILSTTTGLVNQIYLDELWDMALGKIVAVLRTHIVSSLPRGSHTFVHHTHIVSSLSYYRPAVFYHIQFMSSLLSDNTIVCHHTHIIMKLKQLYSAIKCIISYSNSIFVT